MFSALPLSYPPHKNFGFWILDFGLNLKSKINWCSGAGFEPATSRLAGDNPQFVGLFRQGVNKDI
jgi:hypothetical protein